jgi:anti-sigma factor RsiW
MNSSIDSEHLSQELILSVLDDELTPGHRLVCESHLAVCDLCRQKLADLHDFSMQIETLVQSTPVPPMEGSRQQLQKEIEAKSVRKPVLPHPGQVMRRFGWGMGIAATLAFVVLTASRHELPPQALDNSSPVSSAVQAPIEVDGEVFVPVPSSNADLSTAAPHIVQMQVPVSSLADLGIVFEPANPEADRSVLADVLVGADGQPRGVHVIGLE